MEKEIKCAECPLDKPKRVCYNPDGYHPSFCATAQYPDVTEKAKQLYHDEETLRFAKEASDMEMHAAKEVDGMRVYIQPRIVEIIDFCRRMGYHHLGLAFCGGLAKEAKIVNEILETNGFKVSSVTCKVGCMDKSILGLGSPDGKHDPMCDNIDQALILNEQGTEFNIMMGLCVGHDALFLQYSKARCTVLAVKDRVTGHDPLQPVYLYDSYFSYLKKPIPSKCSDPEN